MTNMRALVFICWIFVCRPILAASLVYAESRQAGDDEATRSLEGTSANGLTPENVPPSWLSNPIRSKRNDEALEERFPTRHAKHRKRRRCKNRATCLRGTLPPVTDGTKDDRDAANTVLEIEEEARERSVLGASRHAQEDTKEGVDARISVAEQDASVTDDPSGSELTDSYDERLLPDEIELEDANVPSWVEAGSKKNDGGDDYPDDARPSAIYAAADDQVVFQSLGGLLSKLFQGTRNATEGRDIFKQLNFVNATNEDPCQKWLNSRDELEKIFLGGLATLPACQCQYPSNIFYDDKIWDERLKRYFRWRDVSGGSQRLDVYKPGAAYCVRSLLTQGSGSAAAQHCCYDRGRKLLTRGSGAGTPNFVSPEISPVLHERIDVLPWRLCKGDFSRYNGVRPPNNENACEANPDDEEYQRQIDDTKYY
ncbi:uncharacterized protein LOC143371379 [Andrena cerasifolii]|uniref:uncharacterized protein LOC143371379 n=1 Tax=Andrena cerasifolii TaxID=2819439 RepID=UPI004037B59E